MTATPTSTDPQSNPVHLHLSVVSQRHGDCRRPPPTLTLSTVTFAAGDQFSVNVTPNDGTVNGLTGESFVTTVATVSPTTFNPPTITSVTIAADNPSNATTLTSNVSSTSPASFTYQWLQNGTAILNATSSTLALSGLTIAKGNTFSLRVTPVQGPLTGTAVTAHDPDHGNGTDYHGLTVGNRIACVQSSSRGRPRWAFRWDCCFFAVSRRSFALFDGLVARRGLGKCAAAITMSLSFWRQSSMFFG